MTDDLDPWGGIEEPQSPNLEALRRVGVESQIDFYHGKAFGGRYFLRLLVGGYSASGVTLPKLRNMEIALSSNAKGSELTVTLVEPNSLEMFRAFCADLVSSTRFITRKDAASALPAVVNRIHRWQNLLEEGQRRVLSASQQLGLFGELVALRDLFLTRVDPDVALSAWQGPTGSEQDFQFQDWLFEVKSQMISSDKRLQISSEHQLDLVSGPIALLHQVFSTSRKDQALTLRALVQQTRADILKASPHAARLFDARMLQAGYEPLAEYDIESFLLTSRDLYEVSCAFPRLVASDLPVGLTNVRYSVSVEACSPFLCQLDELMSRAFRAGS